MDRKIGIVLLVLLAFGVGIAIPYYIKPAQNQRVQVEQATRNTPLPVRTEANSELGSGLIADAAERIAPSVVTINTEYRPRTLYGRADFLGYQPRQTKVPRGAGSGVIIDADGTIVTNNHVIQNATRINVTLRDGRELEGRVIGTDAQTDIAVVKVEAKDLPTATLGDSEKVRVGEWVVAVGNPLNVGMTVTAGIVSAIHKHDEKQGRGIPLEAVIQTDAAINPGNSGGALADIEGRLIGINTAIASNTGGSVGIGFAIPVNLVREVAQQLRQDGRVKRPWLGIAFGLLTDRARQALRIPSSVEGVIVGEVLTGSPAATASLRPGDVILRANSTALTEPDKLAQMIQKMGLGEKLELRVWRQGSEETLTATLRERLETPAGD